MKILIFLDQSKDHFNLQVARKYLELYPNTTNVKDYPTEGRSKTAVEVALDASKDEMASLLMSRMLNEKVKIYSLFHFHFLK